MRILSDFHKDVQTAKETPGSYEWWYFDAISVDGYSVVIIFYDGNPFSSRYIRKLQGTGAPEASDFPAISISVYHKEKPLFYAFEEFNRYEAGFSANHPEAKMGNSRFSGVLDGPKMAYTLSLDHTLANGDRLIGELCFESELPLPEQIQPDSESTGGDHAWNLVMPKGEVRGSLKITGYHSQIIDFNGIGYHDHNCGSEPMKESFREWYWGRYHLPDATFIYYLMLENREWEMKAWLLKDAGKVIPFQGETRMGDEQLSLFGLKSARQISFSSDGFEAFLQLGRVIDNGPFYQRFLGDLILHGEGEIQKSTGISEYIYPSRIYTRLFWPLVSMRIRYPDKTHWVQRSSRLYRWTW